MTDFAPDTENTRPASHTGPISVRVIGIVRGREIDAMAMASLDETTLVLSWPTAAAWRLDLHGIEGIAGAAGAAATSATAACAMTVYLRDHDVLELTGGDDVRPFALALMDRACRMPELTRGLRELGAVRRSDVRSDGRSPLHLAHDRWFAPLLEARRRVQGISDPSRQVMLMDGRTLAEEMTRAIAEIAALLSGTTATSHDAGAVEGDGAAEQRALEAAIEDETAPLFRALAHLALTGDVVRTGAQDTRFADWRRWVDAARTTYAAADEAWAQIGEIVRENGG